MAGLRLGILDNGKPNSSEVLGRAADHLRESYGVTVSTVRRKENTSLGAGFIDEFAQETDVALVGVGDCGGCTTWSVNDSVELERRGVATVTVVTKPFDFLARSVAKNNGLTDLPIVSIAHPIAGLAIETVAPRADGIVDQIVAAFTANAQSSREALAEPVRGAGPEALSSLEVPDDGTAFMVVNDTYYERGWTDGLPIVPPLEATVRRYLDTWGRDPQHVITPVPSRNGLATLEKVAINMIMAGCEPEYLPVIEAALLAMSEDEFCWINSITGTGMQTPLVIVSGPICERIGLRAGLNAFSPMARANASIGRALRFIFTNIGGLRDQSTMGHPGKYSYLVVENQEANPWSPLHTDYGLSADDSAVTVVTGQPPMLIKEMTSRDGLGILHALCSAMSIPDSVNYNQYGDQVLLICPQHADILARDGFTKDDIRQYVLDNARVPLNRFTPAFIQQLGRHRFAKRHNLDDPATLIPILGTQQDLIVLVAGGAGTTSAFVPTYCQSRRVTRRIEA